MYLASNIIIIEMMLTVQEIRSGGKDREEEGRQEKKDLSDEEEERNRQVTAGVFPGTPPWKQMLSGWKSFLKKTTWFTQRLQFEQGVLQPPKPPVRH